MSLVAVDIDSTLTEFETPFRDAFFKLAKEAETEEEAELLIKGAYHVWDEYRSPADVCGKELFQQAIDLVHSDECIVSRHPYEGSVATIQALVESGHNIRYISNRNPDSYKATYDWLWQKGFPIEGPHELLCITAAKNTYLAGCRYLIDDRPRTLVEFVYGDTHRRRKAFALLFPFNRALTDLENIFLAPTWGGLNAYLVREGVLSEPAIEPLEVS